MVSIIPPGEPHSTLWQRRAILVHVYLDLELLNRVAGETDSRVAVGLRPVYLVRDVSLEELGRVLFCEGRDGVLVKSFADASIKVLATYLLRNYRAGSEAPSALQGGLGPSRERHIREHIESALDGDLSIHTLASVLDMNPHYFAHAFRLTTGFTPHRYVTHRRVDRAQQLLADPQLSLAEIAHRCGFKSQGQFTTLFGQLTGQPPGKFRTQLR